MSSVVASASSSTRSAGGTRLPSNASTPTAKAMSVATGKPHPRRTPALALTPPEVSGRHRQRRLLRLRQLAFVDLAPDLEAHDEEEDRHQAVVDEEVHILFEDGAA